MFHMLAYAATSGAAAFVDQDMTAVTDSEITNRNGHYIFTEQYQLLAALVLGLTTTRCNVQFPMWNQVTKFNLHPPNQSATIPSPPVIADWRDYPPPLAVNEEIEVAISKSSAVAETDNVFLMIAPPNWSRNIPAGRPPVPVMMSRATLTTPALVAGQWSGMSNIVLEQNLRSGTYAVVGMMCQGTGLLAARLAFARAPIYQGRKMKAGVIAQNAIGDQPYRGDYGGPMSFGEFGRFATFELPQIEFFSNTAGAVNVELRLNLVWLSENQVVSY